MLGGMKSPSVGCDCDVSFRSGVCVMVHGVLELREFEIGRVGSMQHATQQKIRDLGSHKKFHTTPSHMRTNCEV